MHIAEGVLDPPVLAAGWALAAAGVAVGLYRMPEEAAPKVATLASAFFVASLIHVPFGPVSVHLVLNGLVGVLLGWAAFPAIFIALLLQTTLFGFGGLTTLGVNTVVMAVPAVAAHAVFRLLAPAGKPRPQALLGGAVAAMAVALGALFTSAVLLTGGEGYRIAAGAALLAHVPLMLVEAGVTAAAVGTLGQVRPALLLPWRIGSTA